MEGAGWRLRLSPGGGDGANADALTPAKAVETFFGALWLCTGGGDGDNIGAFATS